MRIYAFHFFFHLTRGINVTANATASAAADADVKAKRTNSDAKLNNAPTIANGKLVLALELRAQNYKNTLHFRLHKFNVVDSL